MEDRSHRIKKKNSHSVQRRAVGHACATWLWSETTNQSRNGTDRLRKKRITMAILVVDGDSVGVIIERARRRRPRMRRIVNGRTTRDVTRSISKDTEAARPDAMARQQ